MRNYIRRAFFISLLAVSPVAAHPSSAEKVVREITALAGIQIDGNKPWDIQVHNDQFYNCVLSDRSLGLGESYVLGWWDAAALDETICQMLRAGLEHQLKPTWAMRWAVMKAKLFNRQTKASSMEVIDAHYQLGNDLYERMLDPTMSYSCGYWKRASTLEEAQLAKFDLIARKLRLKSGMRLLDIGCGWGGFAKYVAERYGVQVLAITLSENQANYAQELCSGLPVEVRVQDYRDVTGSFDRVVEIGMFEHVGQKNYREFMEIAHSRLVDGGLLMLHTIGGNVSTMACDPWIDRYIFPNGQLPSIAQIGIAIEGLFVMEDWHNFGPDYDKTLMAWFQNFDSHWKELESAYPPYFYRMWKYYLLSCAGAFRARDIQLWQLVLSKGGVEGGYTTVR